MRFLKIYENFNNYQTIVIAGLPGSGKTTLARELKQKNPSKDFYIVDDADYNQCADMFGKNNIILSDGYMLDESYFNAIIRDFKKKDIKFTLYLFENSPLKCVENLKARKDHEMSSSVLISEIRNYSKVLDHIENECKLLLLSGLCLDIKELPICNYQN